MKIIVSTDNGEVVEIIKETDIGDLDAHLGRQDLIELLILAIERARLMEASA